MGFVKKKNSKTNYLENFFRPDPLLLEGTPHDVVRGESTHDMDDALRFQKSEGIFVCNFSSTCEEVSPWGSLPKGCKKRIELLGTAAGL